MSASMSPLPGNSYRTRVQAMMKPNTRLMAAARKEAPKDRRYEPSARGLKTTCTKSLQCMEAAASASAASGSSTMALRKKVVKPKVSPKPGRTLGWRKLMENRGTRSVPATASRRAIRGREMAQRTRRRREGGAARRFTHPVNQHALRYRRLFRQHQQVLRAAPQQPLGTLRAVGL